MTLLGVRHPDFQVEAPFAVKINDLNLFHPALHVRGEIDIATAPRLAESVDKVLSWEPFDVVLDLSETTFMDASGITVIVAMRNRLGHSSMVIIRHPSPMICRLLNIVGVDKLVTINQ